MVQPTNTAYSEDVCNWFDSPPYAPCIVRVGWGQQTTVPSHVVPGALGVPEVRSEKGYFKGALVFWDLLVGEQMKDVFLASLKKKSPSGKLALQR